MIQMRFFSILGALAIVVAQWTVDEFPNPMKEPAACGREAISHICDPDHVMSSEKERDKLQYQLLRIREDSKARARCLDGRSRPYQGAVAIVDRLQPVRGQSIDATAANFAHEVGNKWGVGDRGCGNGFVMFLSKGDRIVTIKTAAQTRALLPDRRVEWIIDMMKPYLAQGQWDKGLQLGMELVRKTFDNENKWDSSGDWVGLAIFFGAIAAVMLLCLFMRWREQRRARRDAERAERALNGIMNDLNNEFGRDATDEDVQRNSTCPICLEDFSSPSHSHSSTAPPPAAYPHIPPPSDLEQGSGGKLHTYSSNPYANASAPPPDGGSTRANTRATTPVASRRSSSANRTQTVSGVRTLTCGHSFHGPCISEWLREHDRCPLCRTNVTGQHREPSTQTRDAYMETAAGASGDNSRGQEYRQRAQFYASRFSELFPRMVVMMGGMHILDELIMRPYTRNRDYFQAPVDSRTGAIRAPRPFEPTMPRIDQIFNRIDFSGYESRVSAFERANNPNNPVGWLFGGGSGGFGGGTFSGLTYAGQSGGGGTGRF